MIRVVLSAFVILSTTFLISSNVYPLDAEDVSKLFHFRVIWKEKPSTEATISWSTKAVGKKHKVYIDLKQQKGNIKKYKLKFDAHRNGAFAGSKGETYFHHAKVTKLKPSTKYYFVVESDEQVSREFYFTTAPKDDRKFSILFGGDSRSGHEARVKINRLIADLHKKDESILALAHGGDYVANGRRWDQWSKWLSHNEYLADNRGLILPIIPARGNHDDGSLYQQVFDIQSSGCYYVSHLSKNATLITLNTEVAAGGDQKAFLEKSLRDNSKSTWLMAQYHRPLYPAVKGPPSAKEHWVPLFEKYNLNVALEADGHNIKRTLPIRNETHDPTGVVYVGEGGLGVGQRAPKTDRWYLQKPGTASKGHHVMRLDFDKKEMKFQVIMLDGSIKDSYTFKPKGRLGK